MLSLSWLGTDPLSAPSASLHSYPHTLVCAIHGIPRVSPGEDKVCSGKNMGLTLACAPLQCPFKSTGSCAAAPTCSSTNPCFVGLCMTSTGEASSFKDHLFSQGESWNSWSERTFQPNKVFPKQAGEQWIHIWHLRCLCPSQKQPWDKNHQWNLQYYKTAVTSQRNLYLSCYESEACLFFLL